MASRLAIVPIATVALALGAAPSSAAMKLCRAFVTSDLVGGPTEKVAKKRALESWTAKARAMEENASWHVAAQKTLTCAQAADKSFQCLARGYPCTIRQAPPRGVPPLKTPGRDA